MKCVFTLDFIHCSVSTCESRKFILHKALVSANSPQVCQSILKYPSTTLRYPFLQATHLHSNSPNGKMAKCSKVTFSVFRVVNVEQNAVELPSLCPSWPDFKLYALSEQSLLFYYTFYVQRENSTNSANRFSRGHN